MAAVATPMLWPQCRRPWGVHSACAEHGYRACLGLMSLAKRYESSHLGLAHVTWMTTACPDDETPTPIDIGPFGPQRVAPHPQLVPKTVEKARLGTGSRRVVGVVHPPKFRLDKTTTPA